MNREREQLRISGHTQQLVDDFAKAINRVSGENGSNTPDFILAEFLVRCLKAFDITSRTREKWYGKSLSIGGDAAASVEPREAEQIAITKLWYVAKHLNISDPQIG